MVEGGKNRVLYWGVQGPLVYGVFAGVGKAKRMGPLLRGPHGVTY